MLLPTDLEGVPTMNKTLTKDAQGFYVKNVPTSKE